MTDRRDDEQSRSPYDAKFNVAEIGAVNIGEIGAVRKRCREETGPHDSSPCVARVKILVIIIIITEAFIKRRVPGKTAYSKALQYNSRA